MPITRTIIHGEDGEPSIMVINQESEFAKAMNKQNRKEE